MIANRESMIGNRHSLHASSSHKEIMITNQKDSMLVSRESIREEPHKEDELAQSFVSMAEVEINPDFPVVESSD